MVLFSEEGKFGWIRAEFVKTLVVVVWEEWEMFGMMQVWQVRYEGTGGASIGLFLHYKVYLQAVAPQCSGKGLYLGVPTLQLLGVEVQRCTEVYRGGTSRRPDGRPYFPRPALQGGGGEELANGVF